MKSKGLTLLELLVVLALMSIMAALALPDLTGFASRKTLRRQGDEIVALFQATREKAMEQGIPWQARFWPEEGKCLGFGDTNGSFQADATEEQIGPVYLEDGICFGSHASAGPNKTSIPADGVSFVNNRVSFSLMGCCNAGTLYLKSKDRSLAIRLLPASGTARMWEYTDSWQVLK